MKQGLSDHKEGTIDEELKPQRVSISQRVETVSL